MSWQATAWAEKQKTGSSARKVLLMVLANYADENGVCWPSQETLKVGTELSEDTIQRQTKQLVRLGLVSVTRKPKRAGRWSGLLYTLNLNPGTGTIPQNAVWPDAGPKRPRAGGTRPVASSEAAGGLIGGIQALDAKPLDTTMPQSPSHHAALTTATMPQALRHNLPEEPSTEPSGQSRKSSAADRLRAFQGRQEGIEIIQNRIATRLGGADGWTILMRLSEAALQRLTKLEEAGKLDEPTLQIARLEARRGTARTRAPGSR
jgi:hypothetical protein